MAGWGKPASTVTEPVRFLEFPPADADADALAAVLGIPHDGDGTLLSFTEQGAFFDGLEDPAGRQHGTGALLDRLAGVLAR